MLTEKTKSNTQIKILVISNYDATYHEVLPEGAMLIGLFKAGFQVDVMTQGHTEFAHIFRKEGMNVIDYHPPHKYSWTAVMKIRALLKAEKYDILHLFNRRAVTTGLLAAMGLSVKTIVYRGCGSLYWHDPTAWLNGLSPRADRVVCISEFVRDEIRKNRWRSPEKVVTVYKGYDVSWFTKVEKANLTTLPAPSNAIWLACVANVRKVKNIPSFIEAMHALVGDYPQVHCLLIGRGMDDPSLLQQMQSGPAKNNFHVLGFRTDALSWMKACDIYVQPSSIEGLGKTILEAMSFSKPIVVGNLGGARELVREGVNGYTFDSGDATALAQALRQILQEPEQIPIMGAASFALLNTDFSLQTTVKEMGNIYVDLVEKGVRRSS